MRHCERCGVESEDFDGDWIVADDGFSFCGDCWERYYSSDGDEVTPEAADSSVAPGRPK